MRRRFFGLSLACVLLCFIPNSAVSASDLRAHASCIKNAIKRLDDNMSPADVIARGVLSACDKLLRQYVEETYRGPNSPLEMADRLRGRLQEKVIELVLESRVSRPRSDASPLSLGASFNHSDYLDFNRFTAEMGMIDYVRKLPDRQTTITVGQTQGYEGKIVNISDVYKHTALGECLNNAKNLGLLRTDWMIERVDARGITDYKNPKYVANINLPEQGIVGRIVCAGEGDKFESAIEYMYKAAIDAEVSKYLHEMPHGGGREKQ